MLVQGPKTIKTECKIAVCPWTRVAAQSRGGPCEHSDPATARFVSPGQTQRKIRVRAGWVPPRPESASELGRRQRRAAAVGGDECTCL